MVILSSISEHGVSLNHSTFKLLCSFCPAFQLGFVRVQRNSPTLALISVFLSSNNELLDFTPNV